MAVVLDAFLSIERRYFNWAHPTLLPLLIIARAAFPRSVSYKLILLSLRLLVLKLPVPLEFII
jgi:hypothetical protein